MPDDNRSYGEELAARYNITVYCHPCDRKVDIDPTNIKESARMIGYRFRCSQCGEPGQCITSPKERWALAGWIKY